MGPGTPAPGTPGTPPPGTPAPGTSGTPAPGTPGTPAPEISSSICKYSQGFLRLFANICNAV